MVRPTATDYGRNCTAKDPLIYFLTYLLT